MFNKKLKRDVHFLQLTNDILSEHIGKEINKLRSQQGQYNKQFREQISYLTEADLNDLELMTKMTKRIKELEEDLMFTKGNLESWKLQSRENMMLLMEHLGVYLDYEDDKKVIKKDKKITISQLCGVHPCLKGNYNKKKMKRS